MTIAVDSRQILFRVICSFASTTHLFKYIYIYIYIYYMLWRRGWVLPDHPHRKRSEVGDVSGFYVVILNGFVSYKV